RHAAFGREASLVGEAAAAEARMGGPSAAPRRRRNAGTSSRAGSPPVGREAAFRREAPVERETAL
ncbi:MAG: hypothetical protein AB7J63_19150, partial [Vicinamibacterales bacterium]